MGSTKRLVEQEDDRGQCALKILLRTKVIEECEHHPGTYLEGKEDMEAAYRYGNAHWAEYEKVFGERRTMTDYLKDTATDSGSECYSCEKIKDD
jgi:hypothetical protein